MITRYEHQGVVWLDVERPTPEEAEQLADEFKLGPLVVQEITTPTPKPHVDLYPDFIYLVLHFPAVRDTRGAQTDHEVDLVVGKDFLLTVHYETVPAIHDFARSFEAAMLLKKSKGIFHSGHIIFELSQRLYQSVEHELDAIEDSVVKIENAIFTGREKEMVKPISTMTRELLNHKRLIGNQEETLKEFEVAGTQLFGESFKNYMGVMRALHYRVYNRAQMLMDTLAELRSTNDSLLSTRQNEIMKNLTVVASIILPLGLIAGVFGMNTINNPIIGGQHDFWVIVGLMALVALITTAYFQAKKWF
jgi:magnesium transporter